MPSEDTKILELNQFHNSDKTPSVIYADIESLKEQRDGCQNNPEKSYTTKISEHTPSSFSMSTVLSFKDTETKHNLCKGNYSMKKFYESLREHAKKIINFKRGKNRLIETNSKKWSKNYKNHSQYSLQCIDSAIFMASLLPNLKEFMKLIVNMGMTIKKCENCESKYKDYECCL